MTQLTTLFVETLSTIDFAYLHPKRGIVGESLIIDIALTGKLDETGMIYDFNHVKKTIKSAIDHLADHQFLIPAQADNIHIEYQADQLILTGHYGKNTFRHKSPRQAVALIPATEVTPESITNYLHAQLKPQLPPNILALDLRLYPETINGAYYHYSHGLKFHDGNCQRIAHGHRSKILIYRNRQHDPELEKAWAARWKDIYIATRVDLKNNPDAKQYHFAYQSQQGVFELDIPADQVELINEETTVENITRFIAQTIKAEYPTDEITVKNYEGLNKGAIVTL